MSDLISRSALIERLWEHHKGIKVNAECYTDAEEVADEICNCVSFIDEQPTVEAIPKEKLDEIVERLEEKAESLLEEYIESGNSMGLYLHIAFINAIKDVKEVGGMNENHV